MHLVDSALHIAGVSGGHGLQSDLVLAAHLHGPDLRPGPGSEGTYDAKGRHPLYADKTAAAAVPRPGAKLGGRFLWEALRPSAQTSSAGLRAWGRRAACSFKQCLALRSCCSVSAMLTSGANTAQPADAAAAGECAVLTGLRWQYCAAAELPTFSRAACQRPHAAPLSLCRESSRVIQGPREIRRDRTSTVRVGRLRVCHTLSQYLPNCTACAAASACCAGAVTACKPQDSIGTSVGQHHNIPHASLLSGRASRTGPPRARQYRRRVLRN